MTIELLLDRNMAHYLWPYEIREITHGENIVCGSWMGPFSKYIRCVPAIIWWRSFIQNQLHIESASDPDMSGTSSGSDGTEDR